MNDVIKIKSLEVFGYNGTFEEEKKLGQKYYVNIDVKIKDSFRDVCNDINKTVDYSKLILFVREYFQNNKRDLLESITNDVVLKYLRSFQMLLRLILKFLNQRTMLV